MSNMEELNSKVRASVIKEMEDNDVLDEILLYTIPYDNFYLTQPKSSNEVAAELKNVILVAKEKIVDRYGSVKRVFELYSSEMKKIGVGEQGERFVSDKEILEDLLQAQQRQLDELQSGLKVAGIDSMSNQGRIESYFEMVNRKLVVMNEEQKEKYDRLKGDYERSITGANYDAKIAAKDKFDKKYEEEINKDNINNKENAEAVKAMAGSDLGFEVDKITPIEDDLFYDNNPQVERGRAFLVMDTHRRPQIVRFQSGKMEKAPGFTESIARTGEADVLRNDDQGIETKHTYGQISKTNNGSDSLSYSIELGDFGEPKLLEQRPNKGAKVEQRDKYLVREVQTNNTDYMDVNREGNTINNVTRETFREYGYTDDSHPDSISEKKKKISRDQDMKVDRESDFTPEDLADNVELRLDNAIEKIKAELKEYGIELTSDEEKAIKDDIKATLEDTDIIYCDDVVEKYCEEYVVKRKQEEQEKQQDSQDVGRNRLEEAMNRRMGMH